MIFDNISDNETIINDRIFIDSIFFIVRRNNVNRQTFYVKKKKVSPSRPPPKKTYLKTKQVGI